MVKRRIEEDQRAFETGNGTPHVIVVGSAPVGLLEHVLVRRIRTNSAHGACLIGMPHLDGLRIGSFACSSRVGARPSQNMLWNKAAFKVVGELRRPRWSPMPSETLRRSVNPRLTSWQVAQETVPSCDRRVSKYNLRPQCNAFRCHCIVRRHVDCVPNDRIDTLGTATPPPVASRLSSRCCCSCVSCAPCRPPDGASAACNAPEQTTTIEVSNTARRACAVLFMSPRPHPFPDVRLTVTAGGGNRIHQWCDRDPQSHGPGVTQITFSSSSGRLFSMRSKPRSDRSSVTYRPWQINLQRRGPPRGLLHAVT